MLTEMIFVDNIAIAEGGAMEYLLGFVLSIIILSVAMDWGLSFLGAKFRMTKWLPKKLGQLSWRLVKGAVALSGRGAKQAYRRLKQKGGAR